MLPSSLQENTCLFLLLLIVVVVGTEVEVAVDSVGDSEYDIVDSSLIDYGVKQKFEYDGYNGDLEDFNEVLEDMETYFKTEVMVSSEYDSVRDKCKNQHESCAIWATWGECDSNPKYMQQNCAPVCQTCDVLITGFVAEEKWSDCPKIPGEVNALGPGDLNRLFESIVDGGKAEEISGSHDFPAYKPKVLSRPESFETIGGEDAIFGPWVVIFDEFLTAEECEQLIELGAGEGYSRSLAGDQVTKVRTSQHSWCVSPECQGHPVTKRVLNRIQTLTSIPSQNYEHLQMLRYGPNQFYRSHHDYIEEHYDAPHGPRVLTMFLYLNDVTKGGGTQFTDLNITVMPKKGRALLWPNVLDENPRVADQRTVHEATDVKEGKKFAANAWLHMRDFKTHFAAQCL